MTEDAVEEAVPTDIIMQAEELQQMIEVASAQPSEIIPAPVPVVTFVSNQPQAAAMIEKLSEEQRMVVETF